VADTLTLVTSSRSHPFLEIRANRFSTSVFIRFPMPSTSIRSAQLSSKRTRRASGYGKKVMIYQEAGKDFQFPPQPTSVFERVRYTGPS
jgi:hypothetical protein